MGALTHVDGSVSPIPPSLVQVGALPSSAIIEGALAELVRQFPHGGNCLERALRLAFVNGWYARSEWQGPFTIGEG